jgi:signal peptidase I
MPKLPFLSIIILWLLRIIVVFLILFIIIHNYLVQPKEIKGASMSPNYVNGQIVLIDMFSYRINNPKRGDTIIFKSPKNSNEQYIERVIGIPGDLLELRGNSLTLYLNGKILTEPYLLESPETTPNIHLQKNMEVKVPPYNYFVMGDNRLHSVDSRDWGYISKKDIVGKVMYCIKNCK